MVERFKQKESSGMIAVERNKGREDNCYEQSI